MKGTSASNVMEVEGAAVETTMSNGEVQFQKIPVPQHRYKPLRTAWLDIYTPIFEQMKIDIRMNLRSREVEMKTTKHTPDVVNLQKCADFVLAFLHGFDVADAIPLMSADEFCVRPFDINNVKAPKGYHLSRVIAKLANKVGKTKLAIENASKTRIVIAADKSIYILGSLTGIEVAQNSIRNLTFGSPAGNFLSKL